MPDSELNRIVILEKNIRGDLSRCNICQVNFTAIQPCIVCALIKEKVEKKERLWGRRLSRRNLIR